MVDDSHLDERYFVDEKIYNCPFCNRRHVSYSIYDSIVFDWTSEKKCYGYFVECHSCKYNSMHLSFSKIELSFFVTMSNGRKLWRFIVEEGVNAGEFLDNIFFYSVPTSFFVLDDRIPKVLRELLTEAQGCLKSNFLTGASACARKLVYELAILEGAEGDNYDDRIKSLKTKHLEVEPAFFDTLLTIQQVTSAKVHENSYDGWSAKHLRLIVASLSEVLHEMYVVPALRDDRRKAIIAMKGELIGSRKTVGESKQ